MALVLLKNIMKKLSLVIILFTIIAITAKTAFAEAKIVPYYSLNVTEGVILPNEGDTMFGLNLTNDIGLLFSPAKESAHRILGFYELKYQGPGLHKEEGEKFSDRWMDHIGMLRYSYDIDKLTSVKLQLDDMTEYKRTGTNEVWGQGLYDFNRYGFTLGVTRTLFAKLDADLNFGYHTLIFPNYTDLLSEFQAGGGANAESSTGKQNQNVTQVDINLKYGQLRVTADSLLMSYTNQKVITGTVQPDGTYYTSTLQKDTVLSFGADYTQKLLGFLIISPAVNIKLKGSNQNYWQFSSTGTSSSGLSSTPVQYLSNYYAYTEYYMAIPCTLLVSKRWEMFYTPEFDWKDYLNRPPMDSAGNFATGLQHNYLAIMSTGFTYKPNDVTRTTFFYAYQAQTSNMKFEKYFPYNYNGSTFGVNFNYTY
jgi:hypothetical protein